MNLSIFNYGYKLTDFPNHKNITYTVCELHGIIPCTYKIGICDKSYQKEKYVKSKERNFKRNKYCLYHGIQEVDSSGRCKICQSYKRKMNKIIK